MNATQPQEMQALARVDQKRLERLAVLAGRSPRSMLKFVLRDGFEAVEKDIRETLAAERDIASHGTVAHAVKPAASAVTASTPIKRQAEGA